MSQSKDIAEIILQGFNDHFRIFSEITAGAQQRFETADWKAEGLMPRRKTEGLYSAIGFQKQGKTDFYRSFLHHLDYSDDDLILAPGIAGMVMSVFTLPSYPYVFKVIRDYFAPPKEITRKQVEEKYQLVKQHDRVGRMADMLEFSKVVQFYR